MSIKATEAQIKTGMMATIRGGRLKTEVIGIKKSWRYLKLSPMKSPKANLGPIPVFLTAPSDSERAKNPIAKYIVGLRIRFCMTIL